MSTTTTTPRPTTALVPVTCRRCRRHLLDVLAGAGVLCPSCGVWTVAGQQPARTHVRPRRGR
jgi:hypothetical protein